MRGNVDEDHCCPVGDNELQNGNAERVKLRGSPKAVDYMENPASNCPRAVARPALGNLARAAPARSISKVDENVLTVCKRKRLPRSQRHRQTHIADEERAKALKRVQHVWLSGEYDRRHTPSTQRAEDRMQPLPTIWVALADDQHLKGHRRHCGRSDASASENAVKVRTIARTLAIGAIAVEAELLCDEIDLGAKINHRQSGPPKLARVVWIEGVPEAQSDAAAHLEYEPRTRKMQTSCIEHGGAIETVKVIIDSHRPEIINHGANERQCIWWRLTAQRAAASRHEPTPLADEGKHSHVPSRIAKLGVRHLTPHDEHKKRALLREAAWAVSLTKGYTIESLRALIAPTRAPPSSRTLLASALIRFREIKVRDLRGQTSSQKDSSSYADVIDDEKDENEGVLISLIRRLDGCPALARRPRQIVAQPPFA